ncbi:unnamed protein product [Effrenium voratum]|nr:unnamed protein product [Effrenium voratum]
MMLQHVVHTLKKVLNRKKGDKAGSKDVALALEQLPLKPKQREQLIGSKYAFEDVLKLHGENLGISVETQQHWMEALWKCHFKAGPELDRLSARVLTFLSDVELRRGSGNAQSLRLAWFDLCLACCSVSEKLAIANRFDKVLEDSSNSDSTPDDPEPDVLEERESIDPLPRISL